MQQKHARPIPLIVTRFEDVHGDAVDSMREARPDTGREGARRVGTDATGLCHRTRDSASSRERASLKSRGTHCSRRYDGGKASHHLASRNPHTPLDMTWR